MPSGWGCHMRRQIVFGFQEGWSTPMVRGVGVPAGAHVWYEGWGSQQEDSVGFEPTTSQNLRIWRCRLYHWAISYSLMIAYLVVFNELVVAVSRWKKSVVLIQHTVQTDMVLLTQNGQNFRGKTYSRLYSLCYSAKLLAKPNWLSSVGF